MDQTNPTSTDPELAIAAEDKNHCQCGRTGCGASITVVSHSTGPNMELQVQGHSKRNVSILVFDLEGAERLAKTILLKVNTTRTEQRNRERRSSRYTLDSGRGW